MADIKLPRRVSSGPGRSARARPPTAADVPRARQVSDPGFTVASPSANVPAGAFGAGAAAGLGALGQGVSDLGEGLLQRQRATQAAEEKRQRAIEAAAEKQRKRHDATRSTETHLAFESESMGEFRRRQTEDDPARPAFMGDFEADLNARRDKALAGLDDVSPEAKEDLRLRMQASLNGIVDSAGRLSLTAGQQRAADAADAVGNQLSAQAERDPDFLNAILSEADTRLAVFKGTMTADGERDQRLKIRQDIVNSAIAGLVRAKRGQDAETLLASGKFDEELTREQKAAARAMIESGERQAVTDAEKSERLAEKVLKVEQGTNAARITDGIIEGTFTDFELDLALENRDIDGSQFIAARKLLKAQESDSALEDDPAVLLDFTRQLETGTLAKAQVVDAFANKLITDSTMNRFRNEIDAGPDDFRVKEERRLMIDAVAGISGLGAILGDDPTRRVNQAVQEYNERVRGPAKEDPGKVRQDIEARAAEPRSLESLFRPRFMVGADKKNMDIPATKKATLKAYRDGKIDRRALMRETETIKEIEAARGRP